MKSVSTNSNALFGSQLSGIKLELSKYRLNQTKTDTTAKKPQATSTMKPVQFQSRKNNQPDTKALQPKLSARSPKMIGRKPSFSVFLPKEDEVTMSMPSLSEVFLTTEQDAFDHEVVDKKPEKSAAKKKIVEIVQGKDLAKYTKKKTMPKTQVWSFLDLSDKEDGENTSIMGSECNIESRKSVYALRNSYMTTMPDDDCAREDANRRCNTEVLDKKRTVVHDDEKVLELRKRIKELEDKNGKWDLFGKLIIKCYQATRKEAKEYKMQNELDKKTIAALKEQVCTLKTLSKTEKANTAKAVKKAALESEENKISHLALQHFEEQLKAFTSENRKLRQQVSALKEENKEIKANQPDVNRYKASIEHYRAMAEEKLKECSAFAEEIICLRTDLDRLNVKYLKAQKELHGSVTPPSAKRTADEDEIMSGEKKPIQKKNRTKSMDRHSMEKLISSPSVETSTVKHVSFWEPSSEDIDTPSPRTFKMMPLGQDSHSLIKE